MPKLPWEKDARYVEFTKRAGEAEAELKTSRIAMHEEIEAAKAKCKSVEDRLSPTCSDSSSRAESVRNEYLEKLPEVTVTYGTWSRTRRVRRLIRTTATQAIVWAGGSETRFRLSDGFEVGNRRRSARLDLETMPEEEG